MATCNFLCILDEVEVRPFPWEGVDYEQRNQEREQIAQRLAQAEIERMEAIQALHDVVLSNREMTIAEKFAAGLAGIL